MEQHLSIAERKANEWITRELVWVKSTMKPIKPPDNPICFLCLDNGRGHLLQSLESKKSDLECEIENSWERHNKAEVDAIDYKDNAESAEENLKDFLEQLQALA